MGNLAIAGRTPEQAALAERRNTPRYSFTASTVMTEFTNVTQLAGRVTELSRHGCYVDAKTLPPVGTELSVHIVRDKVHFVTGAKAIYVHESKGMGVLFINPASDQQRILDSWLAEIPYEAML